MTRSRISAVLCAIAFSFTLLSGPSAGAQDVPRARIGVIDMARVERESVAWQSLRTQFEELLNSYQEEMRGRQSSLEEEGRQLEQQRSILSSDAFSDKKRQFDQRVAELRRTAQQRKQELDKIYAAARGQIRQALREVVLDIAKDRELNLVFSNSPQENTVVLAKEELLITDQALEMLNERIKTVTLSDVPSNN